MIFYEGAITRDNLIDMPIPELLGWLKEAEEITILRKAELDKQRV